MISKLKVFLLKNQIGQTELAALSGIGITSSHHMLNNRKATRKTLKKVMLALNAKIDAELELEQIEEMMLQDNQD